MRKKVSSTDNGEGKRRSLIRASPPSIDGTGGEHHRPIVSSHKPPKRKRERKIKEEQKGKPPACPNLGEKESTLRKFFLRLLLIAAYPPILGFSAFSEWTDGEIVFPSPLLPSLIFRIIGLCFAKNLFCLLKGFFETHGASFFGLSSKSPSFFPHKSVLFSTFPLVCERGGFFFPENFFLGGETKCCSGMSLE